MRKSFLQIIATVISLICLIQFSACSSSYQSNSKELLLANKPKTIREENFEKEWKSKFDETAAELESNRNLWKQKQIADYDFVVAKSATGQINHWNRLPVLIKIREGEKISIEEIEKDKDYLIYSKTDGFEDFDTIDKLFNYLQRELEKGRIIRVKYHKDLGYPKNVMMTDSYELHSDKSITVEKIEIIKNL